MSKATSPSADRTYGLARVCRVWNVSRSTVYRHRENSGSPAPKKRGPKGACTDDELEVAIREVLAASEWVGEGHRKIWARLRHRDVRVGRRRVLRVTRERGLQSPVPAGKARGPRNHDGTIIPDHPDEMWGTDATSTLTGEGMATIFFVIDHCSAECLGIHAARRGTRFEALEPLRQAVRSSFGKFERGVAVDAGLAVRHDHGSQFVSHVYQDELKLLGIESSPSFVRQPEGNGCAERFVRTLKEQLLWLQSFATVEELLVALKQFQEDYNERWLIERHGYVSPAEHRRRAA